MPPSFNYGDRRIEYSVEPNFDLQTKIRIHVHPNGAVEVETPLEKTDADIASAVSKRARWIERHLQQFEKLKEHALPRRYISGETHFYLGRRYQLKVIETTGKPSSVLMKGGQIQVCLPCADAAAVKRRLLDWYKSKAREYFQARVVHTASTISWLNDAPSIKLVRMKTQWGSCSPQGGVNLNPMLIKAPRECIDYVIVHELCHLREHNHSKKFYALLRQELPNWRHVKSKLDGMAELFLAE